MEKVKSTWKPVIEQDPAYVQTDDGFKTFEELSDEEVKKYFGWMEELMEKEDYGN